MIWAAPGQLDQRDLIRHAVRRGLVKLDDGRIVTLVGWPGGGRRKNRGRHCRLETASGSQFTVHCDRVVAVEVDGG